MSVQLKQHMDFAIKLFEVFTDVLCSFIAVMVTAHTSFQLQFDVVLRLLGVPMLLGDVDGHLLCLHEVEQAILLIRLATK